MLLICEAVRSPVIWAAVRLVICPAAMLPEIAVAFTEPIWLAEMLPVIWPAAMLVIWPAVMEPEIDDALTEPICAAVMLPLMADALTEPIWLAVMLPVICAAVMLVIWPAVMGPEIVVALTEPIWDAVMLPVIWAAVMEVIWPAVMGPEIVVALTEPIWEAVMLPVIWAAVMLVIWLAVIGPVIDVADTLAMLPDRTVFRPIASPVTLRGFMAAPSTVPVVTPTEMLADGVTPGLIALRRMLPAESLISARTQTTPVLIVLGVASASVCGASIPSGPAGTRPAVSKMPLATWPTLGSV